MSNRVVLTAAGAGLIAAGSVMSMLWLADEKSPPRSAVHRLVSAQKSFTRHAPDAPATDSSPVHGESGTIITTNTRNPKSTFTSGPQPGPSAEQSTAFARASRAPLGSTLPAPARLRGYGPPPLQENLPEQAHQLVNLTLDLGPGSVLPAVLAAPEPASDPGAAMTPPAAAAATLHQQFIESNAQPQSPAAGSDPIAMADQRWQDTVRLADERYRALFGKEAFLRQSLQAARVLRSVSPAKD